MNSFSTAGLGMWIWLISSCSLLYMNCILWLLGKFYGSIWEILQQERKPPDQRERFEYAQPIGRGASYTCLARGYPWEWSIRSQNPSNEEGKIMLELHSPNTFSYFLVLLILLGDAARLLSFKSSLSCTTCQIESLILVVYKSLTPLASQNFSYSLIF